MSTAITIDDVAAWLGITTRNAAIDSMMQRCLDAVVSNVADRIGSWVPEPWPSNVETAVLMQSARVYKRRSSPEGVAGFGDLGVVRVTLLDPDVVDLLGPDLAFHFGGAAPVVVEPTLAITDLDPSRYLVGQSVAILIDGTALQAGSQVQMGGATYPTTFFGSSGRLQFTPVSPAEPVEQEVVVVQPWDGQTSNALVFKWVTS